MIFVLMKICCFSLPKEFGLSSGVCGRLFCGKTNKCSGSFFSSITIQKMHRLFLFSSVILASCIFGSKSNTPHMQEHVDSISLVVLGNVQDGGSPQAGCTKACCKDLWKNPDHTRKVVSLGIIDYTNQKTYILDATPDFASQLKTLNDFSGFPKKYGPDGVFLTHAHIGHYTGLMQLGREVMGTSNVPVYAMPRMLSFIEKNGPWSQLVTLKNIELKPMVNEQSVVLSNSLSVTPVLVPHRDEYSETVGFIVRGKKKSALFIPDIDKWSKWNKNIVEEISKVDYAFLDATFFDAAEVNFRDISTIPHPFVTETMDLCKNLPASEKSKLHFIHFNHSNAVLNPSSVQSKTVLQNGFNIARFMDKFEL